MNLSPALLFAAAVLAGWGGAAWWRGSGTGGAAETLTHSAAGGAAAGKAGDKSPAPPRPPAAGSVPMAELIASLAALPRTALAGRRAEIEKWPPGTARDMALALLDLRLAPEGSVFDPFAPLPDGVVLRENDYQKLAGGMSQGLMNGRTHVWGGEDWNTLSEWAALDPAAVSAAVLKMPAGPNRAHAVDAAARRMSLTDPAAAMKLVRDSGENHFGRGAAIAWLKMAYQPMRAVDAAQPGAEIAELHLIRGLNPAQQESLMTELETILTATVYSVNHPFDTVTSGQLTSLARELLHLSSGPAKQRLLEAILHREPAFAWDYAHKIDPDEPEYGVLLNAAMQLRLQDAPEEAILEYIRTLGTDTFGERLTLPAVLHAAAPKLLPQLARAGRIGDAVGLLRRVSDPNVRREALEAILPAWMDADPDEARAAFNAVPLTALEREKWERHPAFLLNPPGMDRK